MHKKVFSFSGVFFSPLPSGGAPRQHRGRSPPAPPRPSMTSLWRGCWNCVSLCDLWPPFGKQKRGGTLLNRGFICGLLDLRVFFLAGSCDEWHYVHIMFYGGALREIKPSCFPPFLVFFVGNFKRICIFRKMINVQFVELMVLSGSTWISVCTTCSWQMRFGFVQWSVVAPVRFGSKGMPF